MLHMHNLFIYCKPEFLNKIVGIHPSQQLHLIYPCLYIYTHILFHIMQKDFNSINLPKEAFSSLMHINNTYALLFCLNLIDVILCSVAHPPNS